MTWQRDATRILRKVRWIGGLAEEEISELARVSEERVFAPGETVFREGDRGDRCYVVASGRVKVIRSYPDGRVVTLAELEEADVFGELALFGGETRSATVVVIEETRTLGLATDDLRSLLLGNPRASVAMLDALADRLRAANERIMSRAFETVGGRVAATLLGQVEAREQVSGSGGGLVAGTHTDIARLAAASRKSVRSFLATLEEMGVVESQRGGILVRDLAALRSYLS